MVKYQNGTRLSPRATSSLTETAYEQIAAAIYSDELVPGSRLIIDSMAGDLQMSITPVREALSRLSAQGLVEFTANRGYVVTARLDEEQFTQLFHARRTIESGAFSGPVVAWSAAQVSEVEDRHLAASAADSGPEYRSYSAFSRADDSFHQSVLALAGNPFLVPAWRGLNFHLHVSRLYESRGVIDFTAAVIEHEQILDAVRAGDQDLLREALVIHIDNAASRLRELLVETEGPRRG